MRRLPWVAWGLGLCAVVWLAGSVSTVGVAPGEAERRVLELASPRTAAVVEVRVAPGQRVQAGEVLAVLDRRAAELEIAIAKSELERLRLEVGAETGSLKERELVTRERLASDAERAAVEVARLEAEERRARAELEELELQVARQRRLVEEALASSEALQELELRRASLSKQVSEHTGPLSRAKAHLAAARARLGEWAQGGDATERVAPLHAAVKAQEERVRALEAAAEQLELRAPFAGLVDELLLTPGSTALAGAPVLRLVAERPRHVIAWLPERDAAAVAPGDGAELSPSDRRGPVRTGVVAALGPGIVELPLRFQQVPTAPEHGRAVYVTLDALTEGEPPPLPGQAFDVRFVPKGPRP